MLFIFWSLLLSGMVKNPIDAAIYSKGDPNENTINATGTSPIIANTFRSSSPGTAVQFSSIYQASLQTKTKKDTPKNYSYDQMVFMM